MSASKPAHVQQTYFGLRAMKKFPELIPLVSILGFACAMGTSYVMYALYQKSDVLINKSKGTPPWERVDPEQSQKFLVLHEKYERNAELDSLKKEIGSYKY